MRREDSTKFSPNEAMLQKVLELYSFLPRGEQPHCCQKQIKKGILTKELDLLHSSEQRGWGYQNEFIVLSEQVP